ncbi:MAG: phosphatidate cytidylyltransferase [Syntrophorhabdales bacterium]
MGDLRKRVGSAAIGGPVTILLFLFLPPVPFLLLMGLVCALAAHEWASMTQVRDKVTLIVLALSAFVPLYMNLPSLYPVWLLFSAALYLLVMIVRPIAEDPSINQNIGRFLVVLLLSQVFLCISLFSFYRLKMFDPYVPAILLLIIWASDTAAYFSGKGLGRHKLAPMISPKKTVEGLIGAIAGALIVTLLFHRRMGMTPLSAAVAGAVIGLLGQVGDMIESIGKRVCGVKDSSSLIPGHGGILDRIDSFILTAPFLSSYLTGFLR